MLGGLQRLEGCKATEGGYSGLGDRPGRVVIERWRRWWAARLPYPHRANRE